MNDNGLLGTMLELGLIDNDQYQIAIVENHTQGTGVKEALLANGFVDEETFTQLASHASGKEIIELADLLPDFEALRRLPGEVATRCQALPLSYCATSRTLEICVTDLDNVLVLDAIRSAVAVDTELQFQLASLTDIQRAQDRFYGFNLSIDDILAELEAVQIDKSEIESAEGLHEHPVVRLVDALLVDACKHRASDIHFEPEAGFLRIRYRIDGVMKLVRCIHKRYWAGCSARLKVLSSLNIAETRAPQDGSFSIKFSTRRVDVRISSFPTVHGENIVLRLLDTGTGVVPLASLGFESFVYEKITHSIRQPHGVVLVVGPTGCGKTTTLYSILDSLNSEKVNIVTLEDPVEYSLPMVRQCSVNGSLKMGFTEGIRSILRQDPDIILVGEIRDTATAELTFRAAMTGHQVFASVHACSALGAFQRLIELGLPRHMVAQQVMAVVSQRLLRLLCQHCKEPDSSESLHTLNRARGSGLRGHGSALDATSDATSHTASDSASFGRDSNSLQPVTIYRAGSCQRCHGQGYSGRQAVAEVLLHDEELERLVQNSASSSEVGSYMHRICFVSLQQAALKLVLQGLTSVDEVERVTGPLPEVGVESFVDGVPESVDSTSSSVSPGHLDAKSVRQQTIVESDSDARELDDLAALCN